MKTLIQHSTDPIATTHNKPLVEKRKATLRVFPRKDEFNVGVGSIDGNLQLLNSYCTSMQFDVDKKKKLNAGLVPYRFIFTSRVADGAMIAGDAAGMTNPVTGGGIHAALYSGKTAGENAVNAFEKEKPQLVRKYDEQIKNSMFLHPIHRKVADYFITWTNDDWKFFGEATDGLDMSDLSLFRSFLIGLKYPKYMLRARELLTIRREMQINQKYGW